MDSEDSEDDIWDIDDEDEYNDVPFIKNASSATSKLGCVKSGADSANSRESLKKVSKFVEKTKEEVKMLNAKANSCAMLDDMRVAVVRNQASLVKQYLQQGFKVDTLLKSGWTALMYACSCGYADTIKLLLENKADINFISKDDMFTPLITACSSKQESEDKLLDCVMVLTGNRADVNAYDRHHTTPLIFATKMAHFKIVEHLIKCMADVNMRDNRGWTALFWAASRGYGQIVRLLLANKADVSMVCYSGQNASDLAHASGFPIIAKVLDNFMSKDGNDDLGEKFKHIADKLPEKEERSNANFSNSIIKYNELEMFLMNLDLENLIPLFNDQSVDFDSLLKMDEDDLKKIGINKFGVCKTIMEGVAKFHKKDWQVASVPTLKNKTYITSEDVAHIILISANHIKVLDSSVQYIGKQIKKNPQILQLAKDKADVRSMTDLTNKSISNCEKLSKQLNLLKHRLNHIRDNVEHQPVDLINGENSTSKGSKYLLGCFLAVAGIFTIVVNKERISIVVKQHPWL